MAAVVNWTLDQGATFRKVIQLTGPEPDKEPLDLTGYSARMKAKDSDGTAVLNLTVGSGITIDAETGTITIKVTDEATALLPAQALSFDVELVSPSGDVDRLCKGTLLVDPEVTT